MKPIPPKMHHWAILAFVVIVIGNALLSFREPGITGDQANMVAEIHKRGDPSLYPHDPVFADFGPGAPWRMRLPAWQAVLAAALHLVGPDEPARALMLIGSVVVMGYLLAMYALLYRQTHSSSIAALVAILSTCIFSAKRSYWGIGPLFAVTPAVMYLAAVPLLVLGFLHFHRRWSVVGVFFLAGLCGNIHLASAINLTIVLIITMLAVDRFRPRAWAAAGASLLAAVVGAAPALAHYYLAFRAAGASLPQMPMAQLREILETARVNVLYPGVLVEGVRWLPVAALLAAPAGIFLSRSGRYGVRELSIWLWLLAAALFVAFGLHGLVQLGAWIMGVMPPGTELFGALRLAMLPLYALFAQAMIRLLRLAHTHRAWVRAALTVFTAVYLGSAYNTRPLRHMAQDLVSAAAGEQRASRQAEARELEAIARWAADERHAPRDALFITPAKEIRLYARRSLMCGPDDARYLYHLAPQRLAQWSERLRRQRSLLNPPESARADPDRVVAFVDNYWRQLESPPAATFLIFSAETAPAPSQRLQEIPPPEEAPAGLGGWGEHWRLFRVRLLQPTSGASVFRGTAARLRARQVSAVEMAPSPGPGPTYRQAGDPATHGRDPPTGRQATVPQSADAPPASAEAPSD